MPHDMRDRGASLVAAGLLAFAGMTGEPAGAQPAPPEPPQAPVDDTAAEAIVTRVVDGASFVLEDGRKVRLAGLEPAVRPLDLAAEAPWPYADEALTVLGALLLGETISLTLAGRTVDRHGHVLAQVTRTSDGLWVQGEMVRRGLARVGTLPDLRHRAADMLAAERQARQAGRGLWAHPAMAIRSPTNVRAHVDSFQLVEGLVLDVADIRGRLYLNFGPDWREDFTVTIAPDDRDAFEDAGMDPAALAGRSIRVRGWVDVRNGAMIEATHPEQIELLDAD
jgi:endonuclease YncB( thermonuclease family)